MNWIKRLFGWREPVREVVIPKRQKTIPWLTVAKAHIGMKEIKGRLHNQKILSMWKAIGVTWFTTDEVPWCGNFVGYCLKTAGLPIPSPGKVGRARSFAEHWPESIELSAPIEGAIVVFWRGSRKGKSGHVGFVVGQDQIGRLMVLGGNQRDMVRISPYHTRQTNPSKNRVIGYYWPRGVPIRDGKLPVLDSKKLKTLNNEA